MAVAELVERLRRAVDDHDLEVIVDCFAEEYRNETPVHPQRGFVGRDQVRRNWSQILGGIPDVAAHVVACVTDGDRVWSEWDLGGTGVDGTERRLRGVIIFTVADARAIAARFYLEPVDPASDSVDDAVASFTQP